MFWFKKKDTIETIEAANYDISFDREQIHAILTESCSRLYDKGVIPHEYAVFIAKKLLEYHNDKVRDTTFR